MFLHAYDLSEQDKEKIAAALPEASAREDGLYMIYTADRIPEGDFPFYAITENVEAPLEFAAGKVLVDAGLKVSTAESCTGGLIAARLVSFPGISASLDEAHVTYANAAKERYCAVRSSTLKQYGAVSRQTAREMAEGVRRNSGADIAVATTGIAGPDGGTKEKPVGLVYIACSTADRTEVRRMQYAGDRGQVRRQAADTALYMLYRMAGAEAKRRTNG